MTARATVAATAAIVLLAACGGDAKKNPGALKGAALVVDPQGDIAKIKNADGVTPKAPIAAADITGVRMDADGTSLTLRIAIGGSPMKDLPNDPLQGPAWFAQLFADTKVASPAYFVAIVRDGEAQKDAGVITGWRLSVCPGTTVCEEPAQGAILSISDGEVRAKIPLTLLDKLSNPFSWTVLSYWNETQDPVQAFSDWVPESARPAPGAETFSAPKTRAVFPPEK